jgi:hypothetical protein
MDRWIDGWVVDRWVDGQTGGLMDRWTDGKMNVLSQAAKSRPLTCSHEAWPIVKKRTKQ